MFKNIYLKCLKKRLKLSPVNQTDMDVIYRIVALKLAIYQSQNSLKDRLGKLSIYLLYSLIVVFFLFQPLHIVQLNIIFGLTLFVWFTALITEYVPKLFDRRDQLILQGKPVNLHLLSRAKFYIVFYDILLLALSYLLLPLLVAGIRYGFLFASLLIVMFCFIFLLTIGLSLLLYASVFQFFSGQLLKRALNGLQIVFVIAVIILYQVILRMYGSLDLTETYMAESWHYLLPSFWYAAPVQALFVGTWQAATSMMTVLVLSTACIAFFLGIKSLDHIEAGLGKVAGSYRAKDRLLWFEKISIKLFCATDQAKVNFKFIHRVTAKSHIFQMKIMPAIGMSLILPFVFLMTLVGHRDWQMLASSKLYLFIYFVNLFIGLVLFYFQFGRRPQAVWIFDVSHGRSRAEMFQAVFKVYLLKYYLPVLFIVSLIYYFIFRDFFWLDSLLVFISALLQMMLVYRLSLKAAYPLSLSEAELENAGSMAHALMMLLLIVPFMGLHYLSTFLFLGKYLYLLILLSLTWFVYRFLFMKKTR